MAGIPGKGGVKGRSGPPGNMNAFKHRLAFIQKRREEGVPTQHEESVRQQILEGLIVDKGGDDQISTATRILAEVIASDAAWMFSTLRSTTSSGAKNSDREPWKVGRGRNLVQRLEKFGGGSETV